MAGLSFLAKKSWHTSNLSNQEKVWLAEQKAQAEAQKVKELQNQIRLEREKEEFEKLAGKSLRGDRGVDWMYEEGGGPREEDATTQEEEKESYLLGKEYVPKGQERHVGDFAAAASMGGVLEKASTRGATIGVGETKEKKEASDGGAEVVRLREDDAGKTEVDGRSEFNREFHLRHEDPMFAVHQKREMQRKDAEKKRNLMERAGLVVKEVTRGDGTGDNGDVRQRDASERKERKEGSRKRKKHHKHRRRRDRSSSRSSSSSSSSSRERRHRKKRERKHRRHDSRRHERTRDRSTSCERSDERNNRDSKRGREEKYYDEYDPTNDDRRGHDRYDHHQHERKWDRSSSCERSEGRHKDNRDGEARHHRREDRYYKDDDNLDELGRSRHYASDERRRDLSDRHAEVRDGHSGRHRNRQDRDDHRRGHGHGDNGSSSRRRNAGPDRDRRRQQDERKIKNHYSSEDEHGKQDYPLKVEGYGLIGTSLSGKGREADSNYRDTKRAVSLGPNEKLLAAKRQEMEKERQARFDQSRRRGGHDGRSREDRERALEVMGRNSQNRGS